MNIYFFDTYALIEIIKGNNNYMAFLDANFRTTISNLYELYYKLLNDFNEEIAKVYFNKYYPFIIDIKKEHIFYASMFKLKNKKKNISYVDALGYAISKLENYKFLTGDESFRDLDNVKFVK